MAWPKMVPGMKPPAAAQPAFRPPASACGAKAVAKVIREQTAIVSFINFTLLVLLRLGPAKFSVYSAAPDRHMIRHLDMKLEFSPIAGSKNPPSALVPGSGENAGRTSSVCLPDQPCCCTP